MQRKTISIQIIFFISIAALISACSSSSYTERYKTVTIANTNTENHTDIINSKNDFEVDLDKINLSKENFINQFIPLVGKNKKKKKFLLELSKYLNIPYKYGGESKNGIDCSAFTRQVYKNSLNVNLPRTAREQYKIGDRIKNIKDLKYGDLIFFNTSQIYYPGHVGIYLGNNLFIHSGSSKGVTVSTLKNNYYLNKFIGATRIKVKRKHN